MKKWQISSLQPREVRDAEQRKIAKMLFEAKGKNPYYRRGKAIKNFRELKENLDEFNESEANWVASWIEYLGDVETAAKIRQTPSRFKEIIVARYRELVPYA